MEKKKKIQKIKVKIVAPNRVVKEQEADFIFLPSIEGDVGIIAKHAPFLANLREGVIRIKNNDRVEELEVQNGFVESAEDVVTILVNE